MYKKLPMYQQTGETKDDVSVIGYHDGVVMRVSDNTFIPFHESNTDYQEYLKWVAEGNTPEPADE